jgi:hypothetical protein
MMPKAQARRQNDPAAARSNGPTVNKMEVIMRKQWTLEMHYPNNGEGSLISSDSFDNFAEVELKIKQNREMVFVIRMPTAPLAGDLLALDDLEKSGSKIKRL